MMSKLQMFVRVGFSPGRRPEPEYLYNRDQYYVDNPHVTRWLLRLL